MRAESVFVPVSVLALWTMAVALLVGVQRVRAARAGRVPPNAFKLGEAPGVPADVALVNRNFMNLLEMPVLFYVAAIAFYVTRQVTALTLALAWTYLGLRVLHSIIHLTSNRVLHRLAAFALSNLVLVAMWIVLLSALV
jgi:hypothetical protein